MDDWNNGFGTPRFSYKPENYQEYHGISADSTHTSDMDFTKIQGNIDEDVPVKSTRYEKFNSILYLFLISKSAGSYTYM